MIDLTRDQVRYLLRLTHNQWRYVENTKGFRDHDALEEQLVIEGIQERLREALEVAPPPDPRYPETIDGGTPR